MHLDLGQGDLVKGAKMHGRRCGAHEKKRDQHLECANLCPEEISSRSVAVGAYVQNSTTDTYVRNLILRLRRRVREFRLRRRVREFCSQISTANMTHARTGHPDSTHNELKHTTTRKTATHERTPDKPHVHTHTHLPIGERCQSTDDTAPHHSHTHSATPVNFVATLGPYNVSNASECV